MNRIATPLAIFLFFVLSGCSNDHRLPFSGNKITGYLFKEKKCDSKNCSLTNSGDFILNVNEQSQKVVYKLTINWGAGLNKIYIGELKNCIVFSVTEFNCEGLSNEKGNLKFSLKYDAPTFIVSKPEDFKEVDAMSDSLFVYVLSFVNILDVDNKKIFETYDVLVYFIGIVCMIFFVS